MKNKLYPTFLIIISFLGLFTQCRTKQNSTESNNERVPDPILEVNPQDVYFSPLGKQLLPSAPPKIYIEKYKEAKEDYLNDSTDLENIIWFGRRTAYLGKYREAIDIYAIGIKLFPDEPRLYRHRGHRYISLRKFDKAIEDLEYAVLLIQGKKNKIEQDGLPNARNIPVSSLHGNIWYHLGLAYYLEYDFEKAYAAYKNGRDSGSNNDNIVSTTHWLYMIQRRMGNEQLAKEQLDPIDSDMDIIENHSYYNLCRFYKGLIPRDSLLDQSGNPSGDALMYGLANWDLYNDHKESAKQGFQKILDAPSWTSFGYIAAEQDYVHYFQ